MFLEWGDSGDITAVGMRCFQDVFSLIHPAGASRDGPAMVVMRPRKRWPLLALSHSKGSSKSGHTRHPPFFVPSPTFVPNGRRTPHLMGRMCFADHFHRGHHTKNI